MRKIVLHNAGSYSPRYRGVLERVAKFKFGHVPARKRIATEMIACLERSITAGDIDPNNVTLVVPPTKSPLPRPITDLGEMIAAHFNIPMLADRFIGKNKKPSPRPYASLTEPNERKARKKDYVKIARGCVDTTSVLIIDDTSASGATLDEYRRAIRTSNPQVNMALGLVYLRYRTRDLILEDINNQFLFWQMRKAVRLLDAAGDLTTTSARVLRRMSNFVFFWVYQNLSDGMKKAVHERMEYYWKKNRFMSKMPIFSDAPPFPQRVTVRNTKHYASYAPGDVLYFPSRQDFRSWRDAGPKAQFWNSDFVVVAEKDRVRPIRFLRNSLRWVGQLEVYGGVGELLEDVFYGGGEK